MSRPAMEILKSCRIVLASGSPRRAAAFKNIGLDVECIPSGFEENLDKASFSHPGDYAVENARNKVLAVATKLADEGNMPDLVIGADTIVWLMNTIFEKPTNPEHAVQMLTMFSGKTQKVYTGVVLLAPVDSQLKGFGKTPCGRYTVQVFYEATEVTFGTLSPETIKYYVETGEGMDKAGGYATQSLGVTLIEKISGCHYNVVGFPIYRFCSTVSRMHDMAKKVTK